MLWLMFGTMVCIVGVALIGAIWLAPRAPVVGVSLGTLDAFNDVASLRALLERQRAVKVRITIERGE